MTRVLAVCIFCAALLWWIVPAKAEERPLPYTCIPFVDADLIHRTRGDLLLGRREQGRFIEYHWLTPDGDFLLVSFDRATFRVCALRRTEHDPRKDRAS
jgi:hypothetical protein